MAELFWVFFRIGFLMFGGGYVMLPLLQREVVEKRGWITQEALLDCFALSQCTPGAIAVNAATRASGAAAWRRWASSCRHWGSSASSPEFCCGLTRCRWS